MKQNKKTLLACVVATLMLGSGSAKADFEISTSLNPVGSGARATGMGGAFIAVADDATAASWNPAGLIHLEKPEFSLVYSYLNRGQTTRDSDPANDVHNQGNSMDSHDLNFASIAYPFQLLKRNMIVTLNYQQLYNMNKNINLNLSQSGLGTIIKDSFTQEGYISAISPAIAIQVLPELSFGATVNIYDDFADTSSWKSSRKSLLVDSSTAGTLIIQQDQKMVFSGLNVNLGLIYNLKNKYSFGFVYKTPFEADLETTTKTTATTFLTAVGPIPSDTTTDNTNELQKMSIPASYGFGFAYRHSDSLSMAIDVYRTEWSDYAITDSIGKKNPLSGKYITSTDPTLPANRRGGKPHDTTQVRVGGEYLFIGDKITVPVRAGFFYDPEPGQVHVDDFFGFSLGSGISINKFSFDMSYQYRWGNRVSGEVQGETFSADIDQHTVMSSLIYHS